MPLKLDQQTTINLTHDAISIIHHLPNNEKNVSKKIIDKRRQVFLMYEIELER